MGKINFSKDAEGNKYYPVTVGDAVAVDGKTLTKKLKDIDSALEDGVESESADSVAEDADASLVTDALRKTPQVLTDAEKSQSRENIGAASAQEVATLGSQVSELEVRDLGLEGVKAIMYQGFRDVSSGRIESSEMRRICTELYPLKDMAYKLKNGFALKSEVFFKEDKSFLGYEQTGDAFYVSYTFGKIGDPNITAENDYPFEWFIREGLKDIVNNNKEKLAHLEKSISDTSLLSATVEGLRKAFDSTRALTIPLENKLYQPNVSSVVENNGYWSVYSFALKKGDVVGFTDKSQYSNYKFNLGIVTGSWIGYQTDDYTITSDGNYTLAVTRTNNGAPFDEAYIKSLFVVYSDGDFVLKPSNFPMDKFNPLYGKTIVGVGDSLMYGMGLNRNQPWIAIVGERNSMNYYNCGVNGKAIAGDTGMAVDFESLMASNSVPEHVDYFVLEGGANDNNVPIPIGTFGDTTKDTFYGGLHLLLSKVLERNPTAKILFLTNFKRYGIETQYVDAMIDFAKKHSMPVFDNFRDSGINFMDTLQSARLAIFEHSTYAKHFTPEAYKYLADLYESQIKGL